MINFDKITIWFDHDKKTITIDGESYHRHMYAIGCKNGFEDNLEQFLEFFKIISDYRIYFYSRNRYLEIIHDSKYFITRGRTYDKIPAA